MAKAELVDRGGLHERGEAPRVRSLSHNVGGAGGEAARRVFPQLLLQRRLDGVGDRHGLDAVREANRVEPLEVRDKRRRR